MKFLFAIVLGAALLLGLTGSRPASAAIVYQNMNTYVLTGTSNVPIGNYGMSSANATFVVNASADWATNASVAAMLFNTAGGLNGPDLYFVSSNCGAARAMWNTYDGCANVMGLLPANANDGNLHTWAVVDNSAANSASLYFDGMLLGSGAYVAPQNNLTIGGDAFNFNWIGTISGFTVYDVALTSAEIADLQTSAPEPSAVALLALALTGIGWVRRRRA